MPQSQIPYLPASEPYHVWHFRHDRLAFKLLGLYDIEQCWVCAASLRERGLDPQTPFVVEATPLEADALRRELANYDVILRF